MHLLQELATKNLLNMPPSYVLDGLQYLTITGSIAYGAADTNDPECTSDWDLYGMCIPHKDVIFPHLRGEIIDFGRQKVRFQQYVQHHIVDPSTKRKYDVTVYNIVKYFTLCMENNPNMIDTLFTAPRCVLYRSPVANYILENRKLFLHRGSWFKFKGYAYAQLHKVKNKTLKQFVDQCHVHNLDLNISLDELDTAIANREQGAEPLPYMHVPLDALRFIRKLLKECYGGEGHISSRVKTVEKYGFDVKFAYHIVRLLNEVEQILTEHDLDLERNREQLKSVRRGEWTLEEIEEYFKQKEKDLEHVYSNSTLRHSPDENAIKKVLLNALEMHFGNLNSVIRKPDQFQNLLNDLQNLVTQYS